MRVSVFRLRRSSRHIVLPVALGVLAALAGCGAAEPPTASIVATSTLPQTPSLEAAAQAAATPDIGVIHPSVRAATASAPPASIVVGTSGVRPFGLKLVGTSITAGGGLAVLKRPNEQRVTVRRGETVDGYTIAAIEPDRVELTSADNGVQFVMFAEAGSDATRATEARAADAAPQLPTEDVVSEGVNTDQSLPEHPSLGPTAQLPEGVKQIGH